MTETISVRGLRDGFLADADAHAQAAGQAREAWLREQLERLVAAPVVKQKYQMRAYGPPESDTFALIKREFDHVQEGAKNCSQKQFDAFKKATEYVRRNGPGDREKALGLLSAAFDEVFEQ